jgi:hypothetical protein
VSSETTTGAELMKSRQVLPTNSADRKALPITSGVLDYFPAALAEVAKVSVAGNEKHNPADSAVRHIMERGGFDADTGLRHTAEAAWRILALLQQELEDVGAPLARGARDGST